MDTPFLASEALAARTVTRHQLRTRFEALHRNVYISRGQQLTPVTRAVAAWLWSGRQATVAGLSAAALHGTKWVNDRAPAELNRGSRDRTAGILVHSDTLTPDEKVLLGGIAVTTPARTAYDIGRRGNLTAAVIHLDALARATAIRACDIEAVIARHPGTRGIVTLRRAVRLMDAGSESPYETRTRLLVRGCGLPPPSTQIRVFDGRRFVARLDMGWDQWLVAVEFDGAQHWTDPAQRTRDIDRLAELEALGWRVVRVSAHLLRNRPGVVIARVRAALRAAGAHV